MSNAPELAIVGHPNKGKSSLVATLAQDDSVLITPKSGTTQANQRFPLKIDESLLYTLVDTPGFQRAREVYEWLSAHSTNTSDRAQALKLFIAEYNKVPRFAAETQLLTPIMQGAGIIYVVDGSRPYGPEYEVEMKILRWTGQASMALINLIGAGDHVEQWRRVLSQYFKIVRVFNPLKASFDDRISLLRGFSHLDERWAEPLEKAAQALITQRHSLRQQCATEIASLLESALSHTETIVLEVEPTDAVKSQAEETLQQQFQLAIIAMEQQMQAQINAQYQHHHLHFSKPDNKLLANDLFSKESWQMFGLDQQQLLATSVTGGALAGGIIDLAVGGHSFFLGAGIGATSAGIATWFAATQLAKIRTMGTTLGGLKLTLGPIKNRNFPYVLSSRALMYHHLIENHSHADRATSSLILSDALLKNQELLKRLPFEKIFSTLRKGEGLNDLQQQKLITLLLGKIEPEN